MKEKADHLIRIFSDVNVDRFRQGKRSQALLLQEKQNQRARSGSFCQQRELLRKNQLIKVSELDDNKSIGYASVSSKSRLCQGDIIQRMRERSRQKVPKGLSGGKALVAKSNMIVKQRRTLKAMGIKDRKISQMVLPGILPRMESDNLQRVVKEGCAKVGH